VTELLVVTAFLGGLCTGIAIMASRRRLERMEPPPFGEYHFADGKLHHVTADHGDEAIETILRRSRQIDAEGMVS
jgi:hypothetical protein